MSKNTDQAKKNYLNKAYYILITIGNC